MPYCRPKLLCIRAKSGDRPVEWALSPNHEFLQHLGRIPYFNHILMKFGHLHRLDGGANDRFVAWCGTDGGWNGIFEDRSCGRFCDGDVCRGCSSTRLSSMNTQPEPLQAAPAGQVNSSALPPPVSPGPTDPASFPEAPGASTDVGSITPAKIQPPAHLTSRRQAWQAYGTLPCPARAAAWRRHKRSSAPAIAPDRCAVPRRLTA